VAARAFVTALTAMLLAAITDIHGNLPALEAIIDDFTRAGADLVVDLGDIVSGPLWPAETADRLIALGWPTLAGNHERQVLMPRERQGASDRHAALRLTERHRAWLGGLPKTSWLFPDLYCCHGTPDSDVGYFLETVHDDFGRDGSLGVHAATHDEVRARRSGIDAALILCGHTHQPRVVQLDARHLVVNPGSAGLQAYDDDHPHHHRVEAGSPHARYALVERTQHGWRATLRAVAYDWHAAARQAEANGRGDWADAISTGRVGRLERDVVGA